MAAGKSYKGMVYGNFSKILNTIWIFGPMWVAAQFDAFFSKPKLPEAKDKEINTATKSIETMLHQCTSTPKLTQLS